MRMRYLAYTVFVLGLLAVGQNVWPYPHPEPQGQRVQERSILYVAVPGRSTDIAFGGVGVIAFDDRNGHRFVKRIPTWDYPASQEPEAVRGIAASTITGLLYISTPKRLAAIDLTTDKMVWEQTYDGECCDRMAVSPDGKVLYVPAYRGTATAGARHWYIVDAVTGKLIQKLQTPNHDGPHNTIWSLDGSRVFLSGQRSHVVLVADAKAHTIVQTVGPFTDNVRPYTINGSNTLMYANVDNLLGFEVADLKTGKMIHRVEVKGYGWSPDRVVSHVCPSHGIALSPDEKELWLADGVNGYMHVFDATVMPPKQVKSIKTRDEPGWITFGVGGRLVYPSSGDVIDASSKRVVAELKDELGREVQSEKLLEVVFAGGKPARTVDQFGVGLVRKPGSN